MCVEATPTADGGASLMSFPGLSSTATRGTGPIRSMFRKAGLFGGAIFLISDDTLYRDGTLLGTIDGSGPITWAASDIELVVTRGASAWSYNGTNLAAIAFPDGANVTAVTGVIGGLFLFARAGSGRWYWSAVLDARTVDALDYATAESAPDNLRDILAIGDNVFFGGEDTIEVWYVTGDLNLPFSRVSQRTVRIGIADTGCMIEMDNAVHFVGDNNIVYRFGDVPERISDHGIEERIEQSSSVECFAYSWQGHTFLNIRLSQGTWAYDAATAQWHERQTQGLSNWVAGCAVTLETGPLFGSAVGANVMSYSGWAELSYQRSREWTAAFPIKGGSVPVDILELEANAGSATVISGSGANPQIQMRASRDRGETWTLWRTAPLGTQGQYRKRPRYRRLGYFDAPGAIFHFRLTEPAPLRVSAVRVNESAAGRSR